MTRDEAKELSLKRMICKQSQIPFLRLIDEIFDDFDNRSCDGCKYITKGDEFGNGCSHSDIFDYYDDGSYVIPNNFCCNRFEPKE
ncbi:MAG: hypothetical protein WC179_05025 [Candidatus Cloacimonadaceae bacterium]